MPFEDACKELEDGAWSQFDPDVVAAFLRLAPTAPRDAPSLAPSGFTISGRVRAADHMDFERLAEAKVEAGPWGYFVGGAGDERTLTENLAAFGRWHLRPRMLVDVASVTTTTTVLGGEISMPILVAPTAFQYLAHPDGDLAMARGAAEAGTVMCPRLSEARPQRSSPKRRPAGGGGSSSTGHGTAASPSRSSKRPRMPASRRSSSPSISPRQDDASATSAPRSRFPQTSPSPTSRIISGAETSTPP